MQRGPLDGRAYVRLFKNVGSNQTWNITDGDWRIDYSGDILFFNGQNNTFVTGLVSDDLEVASLVGANFRTEDELASRRALRTQRPQNVKFDAELDTRLYGSIISANGFRTTPDDVRAHLRERPMHHTRYEGSIAPYGFVDRFQYSEYFKTYLRLSGSQCNGFEAVGYTDQGFKSWEPRVVGNDYLPDIGADAFQYSYWATDYANSHDGYPILSNGGLYTRRWLNIVNKSFKGHNEYNFDISYDYKISVTAVPTWWVTYRVHLVFSVFWVSRYGSNSAFQPNRIDPQTFQWRDHGIAVTELEASSFIQNRAPILKWELDPDVDNNVGLYTDILQVAGSGFQEDCRFYLSMGGTDTSKLWRHVTEMVSLRQSEITPASFLASSDALKKHIEVIQANHLENLSQLPAILELLPDISGLLGLVSKALRGDAAAIKDLIDYVTDAVLRFRFAQQPTAKDVSELLETDLSRAIDALVQTRAYTIQGRYQYVFTDAENFFGDGKLVLDARSKIRVSFDMSSALASYLTANSVGLLPTLSRVWNLLPFSFVVDWFTNMSKRLEAVDNQLLWLALRTHWCLHSYAVTYYPSPEVLASYNLVSFSDKEPFGIRVYWRDFSLQTPLLRESKFDFLRSTRGPDPVTVGSLIWQILA